MFQKRTHEKVSLHFRRLLVWLTLAFASVFYVGQANAGPFDETVYSVLSKDDQDKILQKLADELVTVQAGRATQVKADKQAAKTLNQLLDEVYNPKKEAAWRKYSSKYAAMATQALSKDAAKFARMTAQASVGDYSQLEVELPRIGARVFASMVSDVLEEKGMSDTRYVWMAVISRADTLEKVGVAFMKGDIDGAYAVAKAQALSELKDLSTGTVAGVIDWVFSDLAVAPGAAYVQVIALEIEFINWTKVALPFYFIEPCLETYVKAHKNSNGSTEIALSEYELCTTFGGAAFGEREFALTLKKADLDPRTEVLPMLEAYRILGTYPNNFYKNMYTEKVAQQEIELAAELAVAQRELKASADTFSLALGQRLSALAQELMSEEDVEQLLEDARKALAESKRDADAVRTASTGVLGLCQRFNAAKGPLTAAQSEMKRLDGIATSARRSVQSIPDCSKIDRKILDDLAEAKRLRGMIEKAVADAEDASEATCVAKNNVATAADQAEARQFVQAALDAAAKASAAVKTGTDAFAKLKDLRQKAFNFIGTSTADFDLKAIRKSFDEVNAALVTLREADPKGIEARFTTAKAEMASAQRRAQSLIEHVEVRLERVEEILEPFTGGAMGAEIRILLSTLKKELEPAQNCEYEIRKAWGGGTVTEAWKNRRLTEAPDTAALEALLEQAQANCPEALGNGSPSIAPDKEILQIYDAVQDAPLDLSIAKRDYDMCFALAAVAYSDKWGSVPSQPTLDPAPEQTATAEMPEVIGLEGKKAADLVRSVGLEAVVVVKGAADKLEKKPGHVYAATAGTKAALPLGTLVTLSTHGERPLVEVPSLVTQTAGKAGDILRGAGFVVAGLSVGDAAPTAEDVGKVYSSAPSHPEKHPMFTPVSLKIYGPVKVALLPVPTMKGMTLDGALKQLAAHGDHFVYGGKLLSKERSEGSVLGTVDYSAPGAGEPVPAGTTVVLYFYPPVEAEIGNTRTIPSAILGMPGDQAAGLLRGEDNFFVVPKAKDEKVAQSDQVPGTVMYSVPAAGSVAVRGSTVQLFVYSAPPIAEDETSIAEIASDESEQTSDDSSWIGTWKLTGESEEDGKVISVEARAIISQRPGGLMVETQTLKDGVYEKGMELKMIADAQNILRFDPKILKEMDEAAAKKPADNGILKEPLTELAVMLRQIFETFEISRVGSNCTYNLVDPKKGKITKVIACIRQ